MDMTTDMIYTNWAITRVNMTMSDNKMSTDN